MQLVVLQAIVTDSSTHHISTRISLRTSQQLHSASLALTLRNFLMNYHVVCKLPMTRIGGQQVVSTELSESSSLPPQSQLKHMAHMMHGTVQLPAGLT
jgi:hypothetical protein